MNAVATRIPALAPKGSLLCLHGGIRTGDTEKYVFFLVRQDWRLDPPGSRLGCCFRAFLEFVGSPDGGQESCWAPWLTTLKARRRQSDPCPRLLGTRALVASGGKCTQGLGRVLCSVRDQNCCGGLGEAGARRLSSALTRLANTNGMGRGALIVANTGKPVVTLHTALELRVDEHSMHLAHACTTSNSFNDMHAGGASPLALWRWRTAGKLAQSVLHTHSRDAAFRDHLLQLHGSGRDNLRQRILAGRLHWVLSPQRMWSKTVYCVVVRVGIESKQDGAPCMSHCEEARC
eukprot:gene10459-biopygen4774